VRTAPRRRFPLLSHARRWLVGLACAAILAGAAAAAIVLAGSARGGRLRAPPVSMFQDDQELVYQPLDAAGTRVVERTLRTLHSLGVQRLRVSLTWAAVAPDPVSRRRPRFDAGDPAAYPPGAWAVYDRLDLLAARYGIALDFDANAPAPLWATRRGASSAHYAAVWEPSARDFGQFVHAAGVRYDGRFRIDAGPGERSLSLPRVSFWSVWNEPNQPGWLAPQWRSIGRRRVQNSARLYRAYVDVAFAALRASGHTPSTDTLLFGETAPEGCQLSTATPCPGYRSAALRPIPPLPFLRSLYCLDARYVPLGGAAARAAGCPPGGDRRAFVRTHPALFQASGYAHHPYEFNHPPDVSLPEPGFVPLSDLPRLERTLDRSFAAYGVHRELPLYLTEYGYESNPPNPCHGVPLADQAAYLDEAEYIASHDPRVRALSQFLLVDSAPDAAYPPSDTCRYWSTFQTGLEFLGGRPKPALAAYRLPLWLPDGDAGTTGALRLWGMVRPLGLEPRGGDQMVFVQWRPRGGRWRVLTGIRVQATGTFSVKVRPPAAGRLRFAWRSPAGRRYLSRAVAVAHG
jgi:hypothetical protein